MFTGILSPIGQFDRQLGKRARPVESAKTIHILHPPETHEGRLELFDVRGARSEKGEERLHPQTIGAANARVANWLLHAGRIQHAHLKPSSLHPEEGTPRHHAQCQEHPTSQERPVPTTLKQCLLWQSAATKDSQHGKQVPAQGGKSAQSG